MLLMIDKPQIPLLESEGDEGRFGALVRSGGA
jgi:hypothetical protein